MFYNQEIRNSTEVDWLFYTAILKGEFGMLQLKKQSWLLKITDLYETLVEIWFLFP